MRKIQFISLCLTLMLTGILGSACSSGNNSNSKDSETPGLESKVKEKMIWIDGEANFERFSTKENITKYLTKAKKTGFNKIIVDIRPIQGDVLYKSEFMTELKELAGVKVERDWDYFQFFIDEAHKLDMKVTASTTVFVAGHPGLKAGPAYRDSYWDGKTCMQYTKDGMLDIKNDKSKVAAFLNPVLPEVQEYAMRFIKEVVTKYDIDALALDYCRYPGEESDFSDASRKAFEKYMGIKVPNFPEDIFTWNEDGTKKAGKFYTQWWEFRAMHIHDFIKDVKGTIKGIKPDIELEYWAASWHHAIHTQGQNWASKSYDPSLLLYDWASPNYKNAGFAEHLDRFLCGTYLTKIYGLSDNESIEYGLERAKRLVDGECQVYGTMYAGIAQGTNKDISDATHLCLTKTDGVGVFDIIQVIEYDLWDGIKDGIDRAEGRK